MGFEHIRVEQEGGVATLTLHRPEVLNAYQPDMGDEIVTAFDAFREDDEVRAVVITGAGRAFCAGVDLEYLKRERERAERGEPVGRRIGEEHFVQGFAADLAAYPKPVVVAVNGPAIGVGVTMTLPCDVRIAAPEARFSLPFAKLGMLPGLGSTHLLPRIVGLGAALELVLGARTIDAAEAERIGLVGRVVPGERLLEEARALAGRMAECDPAALAAAKRALHAGAGSDLATAMALEKALSAEIRERRRV